MKRYYELRKVPRSEEQGRETFEFSLGVMDVDMNPN
jgi:hypothetical protein